MKKLLILIFWGAFLPLNAQDSCAYSVSGQVLDISTNEPLPYVSIRIQETNTGTITGEDGTFRINHICLEEVHLEFSYVGYKKVIHHHDLHHQIPTIYLASTEIALEGIVIEGERGSNGLQTLKTDELEIASINQFGRVGFDDLGQNVSGLSMVSTGQNIQKPVIHGLYGNRILIINNGIRHEYQSWGADHAPEIDPSMASSIEVVKGAATVKYGPDALGGVLILNPPVLDLHQDLTGSVRLTGDSNGRSGSGEWQLKKGLEHWSLMMESSGVIQGDLKAPSFYLSNTGKRELSLAGGVRYHQANYDVYGYYSHFEQQLGVLRGSVTGNLEDLVNALSADVPAYTQPFTYRINTPHQASVHDLAKMQWKLYGEEQEFDLTYGWQLNKRKEFDIRRGTNNQVPSINLELMTQTVDINWKHEKWGRLESDWGISGLYQDNNSIPGTNTAPFLPNYNNSRLGVYMVESLRSGPRKYEAGIRYDLQYTSIRGRYPNNDIYSNEINFSNLTTSLGYQQDISKNMKWMTHIGSSWRPPDISELYSFGKHQASIEYGLWRYLENNESTPETDVILTKNEKPVKSEVGWKWVNDLDFHSGMLGGSVTAYFNYIQNYFYTTPRGITTTVRGAFPYYVYRQTNAILTGFDLTGLLKLTSGIEASFRGSYVYARDIRDDQYFVSIPPLNLQSGINYSVGSGKWNHLLKLEVDYVFQQFLSPDVIPPESILQAAKQNIDLFDDSSQIFDIQAPPDGYLLVSMGWKTSWQGIDIAMKVSNLLNKTYRSYTDRLRYFAPEMGRNISLSVKYTFR